MAEYGPMVLRVCRAVVGPADAEDAWSETFLAALRAYPGLPGDARVEAWLVTIAHRKAIDAARAGARRPVAVGRIPESGRALTGGRAGDEGAAPPDAGRAGGTLRDSGQWDADLWAALKALPRRQREAVAYHYLAGLPYKEIAAVTGGTPEAARRAAADGIRSLRKSYTRRTREDERGERR
ncbi:RNA polymerase sigma24 factor [Streptomyces daqingensis]|uniref:RNA polymerase sigma24 factor n=1 Tax=Streptomyces daqingensis TaxID=1472640 RepID=A0ABQ2LUD1_9ACTN|nr:RNA polymerase sigma24 factor [Streptomyces daqingensis]